MKRSLAAALALGWAQAAAAAGPVLTGALPAAVAPGKTTELVLSGEDLRGACRLWTSFAAACAIVQSADDAAQKTLTCRLTLPDDVPPGVGALRVATPRGISSPLLLLVDGLPRLERDPGGATAAAAGEIEPPIAVDGAVGAGASRFYRLAAPAGAMTVEVVAQRIGSPLDPLVRILDAAGRELGYEDDHPGLGADCRLAVSLPAGSPFWIEVRDTAYEGGPGHRFRLRVGDAGLAPIPPAKPRRAPEIPELPERGELEPNDAPGEAVRVPVPAAVSGRFERPYDRDWFEIEARKGSRLRFVGRTRSLGSPAELYLALFQADGSRIAEADASGSDEGALVHTFAADGIHRLLIEELNRGGGPGFDYRLEIEPDEPGFSLSLAADKVEAAEGGAFTLEVTCERQGYEGPLALSVENEAGAVLGGAAVAGAKKGPQVSPVRVQMPPRLRSGDLELLRIVCRANVAGSEGCFTATTLPALKALFPRMPFPPADLDGRVALWVLGGCER